MFGNSSFTTQPTNTFGNFTAGTNTTTPSIFGQTQPNTTMPLFGGTNTTSGFNTPLKQTTFGSSFGGTQTNAVTPLFGAAQPNRIAPVSATTGIFSNPVSAITPFSQGQAQGTSVPFNPLAGTDTMMRNGQPSPISTRHQCISCMKEYENKSLEELRMEDYQLGRKGAPQSGLFGNQPALGQQQQQTSIFAGLTNSANQGFGQQRPSNTFGTPATNTAGIFSNLNQAKPPSLFSSTNTGTTFGAPTFSFPTTTTQSGGGLMFNQSNNTTSAAATPFSFATQPQQQTGINLFNQKPLTTPATTTSTFSGFGNTINKPLGIFAPTASSAPFGSTTNTLGTTTAAPSLFSQPTANKPFQPFSFNTQPATQPSFGQPTSTFSFSTPATTTAPITSFGSTAPSMFGPGNTAGAFSCSNPTPISLGAPTATTTSFPSTFNFSSQPQQQSTGFSFFGSAPNANTMGTGLQAAPQHTGPVPFATTPYKDSPLFYNVITNRNLEEMTKPTNPLAQRAVKEASKRRTSSHFSASSPSSLLGNLTFSASRNSSFTSYSNKQSSIFDGFEEDDLFSSSLDVLSPKSSIKKLSLKDITGYNESQANTPTLLKFTSPDMNESVRIGTHSTRNRFSTHSADNSLANSTGGIEENSTPKYTKSGGQVGQSSGSGREFGQDIGSPADPQFMSNASGRTPRTPRQNASYVKCTRAGYYIEPPVDELDTMTGDDGSCWVEGFTIGRHNFGRIQFLRPVNVAGLNLDDLVHFRHKETVVYPDDNIKPPVGGGINVPAEISMDRIWPIDRSTQEPIKSPARIKNLNYEDKLRRSCKRMDAEFIAYDPEVGVWTFRVSHFSKYTCEPEENEESKVETTLPPPVKPVQERTGLGGMRVEELKSPGHMLPPPPMATPKQAMDRESTEYPILKKELKMGSNLNLEAEFTNYAFPKPMPSPITIEPEDGMDDTDTDEDIEFNPLTPSECESDYARDDMMIEATNDFLYEKYESVLANRAASPRIGLMRSVLELDEQVDDMSMDVHPPAKKSRPRFGGLATPPSARKEMQALYPAVTPKRDKRTGKFPQQQQQHVKQELDFSLPVRTPEPLPKNVIKYSEVGSMRDGNDLEYSLAVKNFVSPSVKRPPMSSLELTPRGLYITPQRDMVDSPGKLLQQLKIDDTMTEDKFSRLMKPAVQVHKIIKRRQLNLVPIRRPFDMFGGLNEESTCVPSRSRRGGRVGFGPNGHFFHILNRRSDKPNGFVGEINIVRLQPYFEKLERDKTSPKTIKALREQLTVQLESTSLNGEEKHKSAAWGNVSALMGVLTRMRQSAGTGPYHELLEYEESMWALCKILWPTDQVEKNFTGKFDRRPCFYQRQDFSQWLASNDIGLFKDLKHDNSVNSLMRQGQRLKACEEAVEQNNCTLALCLAQNSFDGKETTDIQMVKWEKNAAEEFLSDELKELYQICSGCPIWNRLNLRRMSSTQWLQHFAVYNWYLAPINQSIPQVVELYQNFIKMAILPVGCDKSDLSFPSTTDTEATIVNLCINLMKAYSVTGYPSTKLLSPIVHTPDLLDYKVSWLLMNNLIRFGIGVENDLFNSISMNFAGQLETLGCFEWAIFVLQHCDPSEERTCLIRRILERNLFKYQDIKLEKFIFSLGVSSADLWGAKAMEQVKNSKKKKEQYNFLN